MFWSTSFVPDTALFLYSTASSGTLLSVFGPSGLTLVCAIHSADLGTEIWYVFD